MTISAVELNKTKIAPVEGMAPILAERWSPRAFQETPVPERDLKLVLEAGRWAASSSNLQPWRLLVGVKGTETHDKIFSTLIGFNQAWAGKAGVLMLGFALLEDSEGNSNRYALYDLGQAAATMVAQAQALGLHTHSMGGFDHEAARKVFGLGKEYGLGAVIAMGYQDEPGAITHPQMLERELAPRQRKPLSEIALTGVTTPYSFGT